MTSLQLQLLVVTDQYCNIISRGNHKLLSSFLLQKSKFRADAHPPPGWSRFGWFVPGTVCTFLEGEETSHKGQQDTGFILGSQINMHIVVCLIDMCPLKAPCSDGEGCSSQSHWCAAWSTRRRAEQELSPMQNFNVTAHPELTPHSHEESQGFMALPGDLLLFQPCSRSPMQCCLQCWISTGISWSTCVFLGALSSPYWPDLVLLIFSD